MARFVIEHLEPTVSPWVYLEYKHAAELVGELLITNVKDRSEQKCLQQFAEVVEFSVGELTEGERILVLDPSAVKPLSPDDFDSFEYVVIGGIMGDFPPRKRTRKLLTERLNAESRTLGSCQLSIDGAAYIAARVAEGEELSLLEVALGVILRGEGMEIHLPYCYPVTAGGVLFSEELAAYLLTLLEDDETFAAVTGRARNIADYGCRLELPKVQYEIVAGRRARLGQLMSKPFKPATREQCDEHR